jgi:Glycosyltransferase family 9 (heptosyltransferase)
LALPAASRWKRPAAFLHNGNGDKLLALPALRALCDVFPGRLRLLCAPGDRLRYAELDLHGVCEVPFTWSGGPDPTWRFDAARVAQALDGADLLLSLNTWYSDDVVELLARLPGAQSVGLSRPFAVRLSTPPSLHIVDRMFQLARWVEPSLDVGRYSYPPTFGAEAAEAALRIRESLPPPRRVLAVHVTTGAAKMWPLESWRRLLASFLDRHPDYVAFVLDRTSPGLDMSSDRVVPVVGLPLPTAFALVGTCDLFVGIDSCMLHASDLYRVPGVGLFGPTMPGKWGYRFAPHRHLSSPTGRLDGIAVPSVLEALETLLPRYPSGAATARTSHADIGLEACTSRPPRSRAGQDPDVGSDGAATSAPGRYE